MGASALADRAADPAPGAGSRPGDRPGYAPDGLSALLLATARRHPQRIAFRDAGERVAWCGRPAITWSYAAAAEIVRRLALGIDAWRLAPGSRIGLWFSGSAESALAHLAVEAAGHLPCPMPAAWSVEAVSAAIDAAGLSAILTEGCRGARRPAEDLARAAVRHFGLRYLAAFGPAVPDGVISLDAMALERGRAEPGPWPRPSLGVATFAGGDPARPVLRDAASLAAAVAAHLDALPVAGGERILTLLPGHDLRGLVTSLGAALAASATLESLLPFEEHAFRAALIRPVPTRLVVPALFEPALRAIPLLWTIRAVDCVHRSPPPARSRPAPEPGGPTRLDCLALTEDAVLTRLRGGAGAIASPASA